MRFTYSALTLLFVVSVLSGCSSTPQAVHIHPSHNHQGATYVERETAKIADKLFPHVSQNRRIAIGSIVPAERLDASGLPPMLIQQIQEGLYSEAVHYQLDVFEHRLTQQVRLHDSFDQMLSRETAYLSRRLDVDYFLTGTYTEAEAGYVVNARLVSIHDQRVYYAATHFFPKYSSFEARPTSEWREHGLWREAALTPAEPPKQRPFQRVMDNRVRQ